MKKTGLAESRGHGAAGEAWARAWQAGGTSETLHLEQHCFRLPQPSSSVRDRQTAWTRLSAERSNNSTKRLASGIDL